MSATKEISRVQESTGSSTSLEKEWCQQFLPANQIVKDATKSTVFVKKLLAVAVSNITYLRAIFPDSFYADRYIGDLHLKVIKDRKDNNSGAHEMIHFVKGCFDAIEKKYLKTITMWLYEDENTPEKALEAYTFSINYFEGDEPQTGITLSRNDAVVSKTKSSDDVQEATVGFLKTLVQVIEELEPLPIQMYMKMQLTYYDDRTPAGYEPTGFFPVARQLHFPANVSKLTIGAVGTNHHSFKLNVKTQLMPSPSMQEATDRNSEVNRTFGLDEEADDAPLTGGSNNIVNRGGSDAVVPTDSKESGLSKEGNDSLVGEVPSQPLHVPVQPLDVPSQSPSLDVPLDVALEDDSSQVLADPSQDLDVKCICKGEEDGFMIQCVECKTWQHAICYGTVREDWKDILEEHVCIDCVKLDPCARVCIDPGFLKLSPDSMRFKGLWRRSMLVSTEVKHISNRRLCRRLGLTGEDGMLILEKMVETGYADRNDGEDGKSEDAVLYKVNRKKLLNDIEIARMKKKELRKATAASAAAAATATAPGSKKERKEVAATKDAKALVFGLRSSVIKSSVPTETLSLRSGGKRAEVAARSSQVADSVPDAKNSGKAQATAKRNTQKGQGKRKK